MSRYIKADSIEIPHFRLATDRIKVIDAIDEAPYIDIVSCGECKHRKRNKFCLEHMKYVQDDSFCSWAERKEGDSDED